MASGCTFSNSAVYTVAAASGVNFSLPPTSRSTNCSTWRRSCTEIGIGTGPPGPMPFFFQAEDGIRDADVTGVQTCALPILGANGSGKTTLLRILMGEEKPDAGKVEVGHLVDFGYYDQHLEVLDADKPLIRAVWPGEDPDATEQQLRDLLGRFGLVGDQVYQRVGDLSGGERSRGALARLVAQGVNVLVLDEPTNHLDLWACDALEQALLEFEGTVIVVSHDRYFLNRVVDLLIVLDGQGRAQVIHGNYDTYERMRLLQEEAKAAAPVRKEIGRASCRER